jgi:hypothetical protein
MEDETVLFPEKKTVPCLNAQHALTFNKFSIMTLNYYLYYRTIKIWRHDAEIYVVITVDSISCLTHSNKLTVDSECVLGKLQRCYHYIYKTSQRSDLVPKITQEQEQWFYYFTNVS